MNCKCLETINARLKEKNLKLSGYALTYPDFEAIFTINTEWIDRDKAPKGQKRSPTKMFVSHCPFCGTPVKEDKTVLKKKRDSVEPLVPEI
jgi:hypothetical protein